MLQGENSTSLERMYSLEKRKSARRVHRKSIIKTHSAQPVIIHVQENILGQLLQRLLCLF